MVLKHVKNLFILQHGVITIISESQNLSWIFQLWWHMNAAKTESKGFKK